MKLRVSLVTISLLAALVAGGEFFPARAQSASENPPPAIPTFPTDNIGREGHFYVGGHYEGRPGSEIMFGAMYVEVMVPKKIRHPYPVIFICGGAGQTAVTVLQTPDGRPGWAYDFLNQGYTVYVMDLSRTRPIAVCSKFANGRKNLTPPRTSPADGGSLVRWASAVDSAEHLAAILQANRSGRATDPTRKMGDPIFDQFAKTEIRGGPRRKAWRNTRRTRSSNWSIALDSPSSLLLHSGVSTSGWELADARPKMIKGIVAAEPVAPPIENAERGSTGPGRLWGLTNLPVHYDPPAQNASDLQTVRQDKADGPDLIPCWVQKEPARKLVNLVGIPVLDVSGEASYHRPVFALHRQMAESGGREDHLRESGRRRPARQRPHHDGREKQRGDCQVPAELDR